MSDIFDGQVFDYRKKLNKSIKFVETAAAEGRRIAAAAFSGRNREEIGWKSENHRKKIGNRSGAKGDRETIGEKEGEKEGEKG